MQLSRYTRWGILLGLLVLLFVLNLSLGSVNIPFGDIVRILFGETGSNVIYADIIWDFRVTKALTCILAGSALSIGGLQMQTLFRNALAGPDVLGLSSGASLAVSLLIMSQATGISIFSDPSPWAIVIAVQPRCRRCFCNCVINCKAATRQYFLVDHWINDGRRYRLSCKCTPVS